MPDETRVIALTVISTVLEFLYNSTLSTGSAVGAISFAKRRECRGNNE